MALGVLAGVLTVLGPAAHPATARPSQAVEPIPRIGPVEPYLTSATRVSGWDFFDPGDTGGDPTSLYFANRLRFGFRWESRRWDIHAAGQYVQFAGLPGEATGPGALGAGGAYRAHNGKSSPGSAYLRYLYAQLKDLGTDGLRFQAGRFGYSAGAEAIGSHPKIERVKSLRVSEKLIGEFGWSLFQRSYDGVRIDWDHGAGRITLAGFQPTQGGFERHTGASIDDVRVYTGAWTLTDGVLLPSTEVQAFVYSYDDERAVTGPRPDNTGRSTKGRMDIQVRNFGAHVVGAYPWLGGEVDVLFWYSAQTGSWFNESHRAQAVAAELGYQWDAPLQPWVRAGYLRGTGDEDPGDRRHGTFFQMLPTTRKYSLSAAYNLMNNTDLFIQALLTPGPGWTLRADIHDIGLSDAGDGWYSGAGATQARGTIPGFGSRPSFGRRSLGTVLELENTYRVNSYWSLTAYWGHIWGGGVVRGSFPAGDQMNFAFVESNLNF